MTEKKETKGKKDIPAPKRYLEGIGRRKTAVARVRLTSGNGSILINGSSPEGYFRIAALSQKVLAPLDALKSLSKFGISVKVSGGGLNAQAEAVRHGLARALVAFNPDFKKKLRKAGFLTRDPRMVERKKYGLKKARRTPQWAKR